MTIIGNGFLSSLDVLYTDADDSGCAETNVACHCLWEWEKGGKKRRELHARMIGKLFPIPRKNKNIKDDHARRLLLDHWKANKKSKEA